MFFTPQYNQYNQIEKPEYHITQTNLLQLQLNKIRLRLARLVVIGSCLALPMVGYSQTNNQKIENKVPDRLNSGGKKLQERDSINYIINQLEKIISERKEQIHAYEMVNETYKSLLLAIPTLPDKSEEFNDQRLKEIQQSMSKNNEKINMHTIAIIELQQKIDQLRQSSMNE